MIEDARDRSWGYAILAGIGAGLLVLIAMLPTFFVLVFVLIFAGEGILHLLPGDPISIDWASFHFPACFFATVGAVPSGALTIAVSLRYGRWNWAVVATVCILAAWCAWFVGVPTTVPRWIEILYASLTLFYGAVYGLLFWWAVEWIKSMTVEVEARWSKRSPT